MEIEPLLIVEQNNFIKTDYVKPKIDNISSVVYVVIDMKH